MAETVRFFEFIGRSSKQRLGGEFPRADFLQHVVSIPEGEDRKVVLQGRAVLGHAYPEGAQPQILVAHRLRRDFPVNVERGGVLEPVDLGEDGTVAYASHVAIFPRNVVGILVGPGGPTHGLVAGWITAIANLNPAVALRPLLRADVFQKLQEVQKATYMRFRVPAEAAPALPAGNSVSQVARTLLEDVGDVIVDLEVRVDQRGSRSREPPRPHLLAVGTERGAPRCSRGAHEKSCQHRGERGNRCHKRRRNP